MIARFQQVKLAQPPSGSIALARYCTATMSARELVSPKRLSDVWAIYGRKTRAIGSGAGAILGLVSYVLAHARLAARICSTDSDFSITLAYAKLSPVF